MPEWTPCERPVELRERAEWYRAFAKVCAGDSAWALQLAEHFDRLAAEREHMLFGGPPAG